MDEKIVLKKEEKVGFITINRPEVSNALDHEAIDLFFGVLKQLEQDDKINVVVIRSSGTKVFCAGVDIKEGPAENKRHTHEKNSRGIVDLFKAIMNHEKIVICSVQGYALGAGLGIVAASDMAIITDNAVFGLPEINLGFFPFGLIVPIIQSLGRKEANELFFSGGRIDACRALSMGLSNKIVPPEKLAQSTMDLAVHLAGKDPSAVRAGKKAILTAADMEFNKAIEYTHILAELVQNQFL